jgi:hypothetical protein
MPDTPDVPAGVTGPMNATIQDFGQQAIGPNHFLDITRGSVNWEDSPDPDEATSLDPEPQPTRPELQPDPAPEVIEAAPADGEVSVLDAEPISEVLAAETEPGAETDWDADDGDAVATADPYHHDVSTDAV